MSGRKRKIGALTSQDYADQLHQLEQREQIHACITQQQKEAARKKKRSLKNRMSALKCREKQRAKFEYLEQEVKRLRQRINILRQENQDMQKAYHSGLIAEHKYKLHDINRQARAIWPVSLPTENITGNKHSFPMPSVPSSASSSASLASAFFDAQKNSAFVKPCARNSRSAVSTARSIHPLTVTSLNFDAQKNSTGVNPRTHNYRSTVSTARNSHPLNVTALHSEQYSHMLRGMPWESFRSIFLRLLECTKDFVASKTSKEILAAQVKYSQSTRSLRQLFWKTLVSTGYENHFVGVPGTTAQKRACVIFDNICDNIYEALLERDGIVSAQRLGVEY